VSQLRLGAPGMRLLLPLAMVGWVLLVLAAGTIAPGTQALMNARTSNPTNGSTTTALYAPASLAGSAVGRDVVLAWPAGRNGDGYALELAANGATPSCAAAGFAPLAALGTTGYRDVGRSQPAGTFACYRVRTTSSAGWSSVEANPVVAVQVGFVASSLRMVNDGSHAACSGAGAGAFGRAGSLDCGDQVIVGFNQPIDPASMPPAETTVCTDSKSGTIWLGSTSTSGTCKTSEVATLGSLTGGGLGECDCRFAATYALGAGNTVLTVTIGERIAGGGGKWPSVGPAAWVFTPTADAARLRAGANGDHVCVGNGGDGNCLPTTGAGTTI
jgi:hypothetical protein